MSTFKGVVDEFPDIRIDYFRAIPNRRPPLQCFLSHIHSDHLQGLESLKSPFVYCSPATRELLLRLEKYPHRMNFTKHILECRKQHYKHLKSILKTIPLDTPTEIELSPGKSIQVTLLDANHCSGAVMFLIEDERKAILYTGDIRSEPWWVNALVRNPVVLPYTALGYRCLDKIYLDTTFAQDRDVLPAFPSKADGLAELLGKVSKYPEETVFHFHAWTPGYEEVWIALAHALGTQVHVDDYKLGLYRSLKRTHILQSNAKNDKGKSDAKAESFLAPEAAALCGHQCGNNDRPGCLTSDQKVRLHSCEAGTECSGIQSADVVWITPIITRSSDGTNIPEMGAGGGGGDLTQTHELDLSDTDVVFELLELCLRGIEDPTTRHKMKEMIKQAAYAPSGKILLADLDIPSLDHDISLDEFSDLLKSASNQGQRSARGIKNPATSKTSNFKQQLPRTIQFPYSRHSSYDELCHLVSVFKPKDVYPCTTDEKIWSQDVSIRTQFGHLCSGDIFSHDLEMEGLEEKRQAWPDQKRQREEGSSQNDLRTSSQASVVTEGSQDGEDGAAKFTAGQLPPASTLRQPADSAPRPKRRRTDDENLHTSHITSPKSANTASTNTYSGHRRLNDIQQSFESYLAQPSANPRGISHSVSDPSPLLRQRIPESTISSTGKSERNHGFRQRRLSIQSPEKTAKSQQASSTKPKAKAPTNRKDNNLPLGTQSRPVEVSSDSDEMTDSATDDERTPTRTQPKNVTGLGGAHERDHEEDKEKEREQEQEQDTQLTLSDSAFESQEEGQRQANGSASSARVEYRKAAYKAAREQSDLKWEGLISSGSGHGREEVEL